MSVGNVVIHSNQLSANRIEGKILKNGDQVLVRVAADKGNGTYEGYVSGAKVTIHSSKVLIPGQSFPAVISEKNGVIFISPKNEITKSSDVFKVDFIKTNQISNLMEMLGLPEDEISIHLLLQMKQMEMKIDTQLINKLRIISAKFKGKSKIAAEIMLLLEQKGLKASDEEIKFLLSIFERQNDESQTEKDDYRLLNQFNKKDGSWYLLPYDIIDIKNNKILGNGFINILKVNDVLKQMNLEMHYLQYDNYFNLLFENNKPKEIKYNVDNSKIKEKLEKLFTAKKINFQECDADSLKGTGCDNETIISAGGVV